MSGISTSITWICSRESAGLLAAAINQAADWSNIEPWDEQRTLCVTSRNNHLEYNIRRLFAEFVMEGASYFRTEEAYVKQGQQAFAAAVYGADLEQASHGLKSLLDAMKDDPAKCVAPWQGIYSAAEIQEQQRVPLPDTFEYAKALVAEGDDNDRFRDAMVFLQAHYLAVQQALIERRAILYAAMPC